MLEAKNLQYWYKPERPVLRDVSFSVASGEIVCLLGPNGTGKTTLLRCLLGLYAPKSGSVVLDGQSLSALANRERAKRYGLCAANLGAGVSLRGARGGAHGARSASCSRRFAS